MTLELETERLMLQPFELADWPPIHHYMSQDEVASPIKELLITPHCEGADGHAIGTDLSLMSQLTFDWLDEVIE